MRNVLCFFSVLLKWSELIQLILGYEFISVCVIHLNHLKCTCIPWRENKWHSQSVLFLNWGFLIHAFTIASVCCQDCRGSYSRTKNQKNHMVFHFLFCDLYILTFMTLWYWFHNKCNIFHVITLKPVLYKHQ